MSEKIAEKVHTYCHEEIMEIYSAEVTAIHINKILNLEKHSKAKIFAFRILPIIPKKNYSGDSPDNKAEEVKKKITKRGFSTKMGKVKSLFVLQITRS